MKNPNRITKILLSFTLASFIIAPPPFEGHGSALLSRTARGHQNCSIFTVNNTSSYAVGDVQVIGGTTQSDNIPVTGTGTFNDNICFTASSVIINGQEVVYPNPGTVTLSPGVSLNVTWTSANLVVLKDSQGWN